MHEPVRYLLVEPQTSALDARVWQSLMVRSLVMAAVAPLVIYPIGRWGKSLT